MTNGPKMLILALQGYFGALISQFWKKGNFWEKARRSAFKEVKIKATKAPRKFLAKDRSQQGFFSKF